MSVCRIRLSLAPVLVAVSIVVAAEPDPELRAAALWPDHPRVLCVEVANGPARQFNGLASVELPPGVADGSLRVVELDGAGRPVARVTSQVDREGGKVRLWLPLTGVTQSGAKRRFLLFAGGPKDVAPEQDRAAPPERSFDALRVESADEQIRIANQFYRTTQPQRGNGGFPTSVTFVHTGLMADQFTYEDRLYDATAKKCYGLKSDTKASTKVVCSGPLRATVEAAAHYALGDVRTDSNARAVYRYEFRAGSPLIGVTADVSQDADRRWNELHFLQLSTKGRSFPIWRAGEGLAGRFTGSKNSRTVPRWGVMGNGADAIGLLTAGGLIWYDDPDGYCNYFQFPVVQWSARSHRFAGWIYIGPLQPHTIMDGWSARLAHPLKATVRPLKGLQSLREKLAAMPREPDTRIQDRYRRALHGSLLGRDPTSVSQEDLDAIPRMVSRFAETRPSAHSQLGPKGKSPDVIVRRVGDVIWLANPFAVYQLDLARGGRIVQIVDLKHGRDFIGPGQSSQTPLWRVGLRRKDGKALTVDSRIAGKPLEETRFNSRGGVIGDEGMPSYNEMGVTLKWPAARVSDCQGTIATRLTLAIRSDRPVLRARLALDNQLTDAGFWTVEFPVIAPLGQRGRIDVAVPRGNWGILSRALAGGTGGSYPSGNWPMGYVSVTDGPSTLYLADHHPRCSKKRFALQAGGEFRFIIEPPDMGKPGADYVMDHDMVVGPIDGDWFDAARVYRAWAHEQIWMSKGPLHQRDDVPRKLRDGLVWVLLNGGPDEVVPKVIAAQEFLGVPVGVHWYNWHKIPFDDDYPHYFPTKDGVAQAVKTLTDRGIYVMPYINGRLWDSDTTDFETVAKPACTKDVNGKPYIETYGSGQKLVPMCPTTKVWQDKVCEIIDGLVNKVGVNAVYLDQIAAAGPRLCFDSSHGHPLGGGAWWCPPYWQMMDRIQKIGAAKSPDVFFTTENNAECYSQNIDAFLVWNPRRPDMVPINAVVYGDMRVHFANRVNPADSETAFAMKVGRDFLWGTQLGWMAPFYLEPAHKGKGIYFRRLARARMMANKFLAYGQMLRPPKIRCGDEVTAEWFGHKRFEHTVTWPAVGGACWRAPDGHVGLIFTNYDDKPHQFDFCVSSEFHRLAGRHAIWCRLTPDGPRRVDQRVTRSGYYRARIAARDVLVFEIMPCASAAEREGRLKTLPEYVATPQAAPLDQPSTQRPLWAELKLPSVKTPAGESVSARLVVNGQRPQGSSWRVRIDLPSGYAVEPASLLTIDPKASGPRSIEVLIHTPTDAGEGDVPIEIELIRGVGRQSLQLAPPRKKVKVPKTSSAITIDGKFGDWKTAGRLALDGRSGNHVTHWTGPADLSADVRLCRDEERLFMAVDVRDDVHAQARADHFIWQGDAIQVAFQPDPACGADYASQVVEFGLSLGPSGPYAHEWMPADARADGIRLAAVPTETGLAYEAAIPIASIRRDRVGAVGFSMTVNESDEPDVFDGWLEWTPGICGAKTVADFGRLQLAD